jgi:hypothetical protein
MKCSNGNRYKQLWVAVKVERGYITKANIYDSSNAAKQIVQRWQACLNPDYDEAAVVESRFVSRRINKSRRSR